MKKRGFTLIELLVVISIIALLLAILMPSLAKIKQMTRTLVCTTNLKSCGTYFIIFMEENEGRFVDCKNQRGPQNWKTQLHYLWKDAPEIFMCPTTSPDKSEPFKAKTLTIWVDNDGDGIKESTEPVPNHYDSYGLNYWINSPDQAPFLEYYWKNKDMTRNPNDVPMLGDHNECSNGAWASTDLRTTNITNNSIDEASRIFDPPVNEQDPWYNDDAGNTQTIREFCIDRHQANTVFAFMDGSARKVGIKEMWTLSWARGQGWDVKNEYTIAGNNGDTAACAQNWDNAAPWMSSMKEY